MSTTEDQPEDESEKNPEEKTEPETPEEEKRKVSIPVTKKESKKQDDFDASGVTLIEDHFGQYFDEEGVEHQIKRFTWRNKNKIQIQAINYGARVISIKLPDRYGEIEDVLLGFDDVAGYLFYNKYYFGAVLGRVSNVIKHGTFYINKEKYTVNTYLDSHNGGHKGFDKIVWDTFISGNKVIMTHLSPHLAEGYPGDLLVSATFELSAKNEFKVNLQAQTTRPTCINFSHLLYFNLAGHHAGPDETYKHILTLNCNCFTPQVNKIPTGEILNVIHSPYDFQIPKQLGKVIGIVPKDGIDQNLCVNRGMYQDECFVGRLLHPPSGRMIEIYSNQPGVQLNTANHFGYGNILTMEEIQNRSKTKSLQPDEKVSSSSMLLFEKVHKKVLDILKLDEKQNYDEIKRLIWKFRSLKSENPRDSAIKLAEEGFVVTPMQHGYLTKAKEIVCENDETDDVCLDLKEALSKILKVVRIQEIVDKKVSTIETSSNKSSRSVSLRSEEIKSASNTKGTKKDDEVPKSNDNLNQSNTSLKKTSKLSNKADLNKIPPCYKNSDQIFGKDRALYKMHGGVSLQTQNYPNAVNIKHFPSPILNPGEVYKHDIVYRFWIRAGNPSKWIRRNLLENRQKAKSK